MSKLTAQLVPALRRMMPLWLLLRRWCTRRGLGFPLRRRSRKTASGGAAAAPEPPVVKDQAWFEAQVQAAREDRTAGLLHPATAYQRLGAVMRHRKRWVSMVGSGAAAGTPVKTLVVALALALPTLVLIPVEDTPLVIDLMLPVAVMGSVFFGHYVRACYREAFIRVLVLERLDFVEPHIPTGVLEVYIPRAAVAGNPERWRTFSGRAAYSDPDAYMWLTLGDDGRIRDITSMEQIYGLVNDDYRMEDVVNVERRAYDRQVQSTGFLAGDVAEPKGERGDMWQELLPHVAGIGFALFGVVLLVTLNGGN